MAKYVDVEKVFCADCEDRDRCGSPDLFCDVHSMPAADVAPVVHGEWEKSVVIRTDTSVLYDYTCSECCIVTDRDSNFCPNCGADMRERKGDDA